MSGGLRVLDMTALVVGYGLAAVGLRTIWPRGITPTIPLAGLAAVVYAWLGLAISGPFVLLLGRFRAAPEDDEVSRFTRAETAWVMIGLYWIAVVVVVLPADTPATVALVAAPVPLLAATLLWLLTVQAAIRPTSWTHTTAVVVLASWPIAWVAMIFLTRALYG